MATLTPLALRSEHYACRILDRLERAPEAIVVRHGDRAISAGELRSLICGAVSGLLGLGIRRGSTVGALTEPNDPSMLVIRYAANLIGARIVYVRSVNPRTEETGITAAERARILRETGATALFADPPSMPEALALATGQGIPVCGFEGPPQAELFEPSSELPAGAGSEWEPARVAAVIYTSGTTGAPKGVQMSFGAWDSMARGFARSQGRPLTFLAVTPISQASGTMLDGCIAAGGAVVLHRGFDAGLVLDAIAEHDVGAIYMAMPHLYSLLDHPRIGDADLSSLACLIYSGTPASTRRMEQAAEVFGPALIQSYGTTEAGPIAVLLPMAHRSPDLRRTVGRPLPGVRIRICDPLTKRDLDVGATGEVWVRSASIMSGYLGAQVTPVAAASERWLRTGDLGTIDARGYLSLHGRVGDVIKCRGIKIYPSAVIDALASHPDVAQAHVYGVRGDDEVEEVHAAVVLTGGVGCEALREHVAETLTREHVPDAITVWSELPLTPNGKPDRRRLADGTETPDAWIVRKESWS
jgi:fatty-acyl-CoA synthase